MLPASREVCGKQILQLWRMAFEGANAWNEEERMSSPGPHRIDGPASSLDIVTQRMIKSEP